MRTVQLRNRAIQQDPAASAREDCYFPAPDEVLSKVRPRSRHCLWTISTTRIRECTRGGQYSKARWWATLSAALEGVRVIECGEMVSAAYAAKIFAHMGADVIKVEEPGGDRARRRGPFPGGIPDPERSGLFLYLNQHKRSVVLDLLEAAGQAALMDLAAGADVLIHNFSPTQARARALDIEQLRARRPALIVTSITRFGLTGPHSEYNAHEITSANAGGWAFISPGALEDRDLPPLKAFGQQCDFQAGINAANATLGALIARLTSGLGEHIDVSVQECVAANLEMNFMHWTYASRVASRLGRRALGPWGMLRCRDGLLFVVCVEEAQWGRLVELLGGPEWAAWEVFSDRLLRAENYDVLSPLLEESFGGWTVEEAYQLLQARRVPCAPVAGMDALLNSDHLQARDFFVDVDHPVAGRLTYPGAPFKHSRTPWQTRVPAPTLGQHTREVLDQRTGAAIGVGVSE